MSEDFKLDKKELLKDCHFALKALLGPAIDYINNLDVNHDGKKDISQLAPYVINALPVISALVSLIDADEFISWVIAHDFVKDKEAARRSLDALLTLATNAAEKLK